MNLHRLLLERAQSGNPIHVGLIGAGKFGSMFLAQAHRTPGLHLAAVVDLAPARARAAMAHVGWPAERIAAPSLDGAMASGTTFVGDDAEAMIASPRIEVVIDATGVPAAGIRHALLAIEHGKHIVMVNVEADVLVGPLLAERAARAGVVYSMAYGDQPALIAEQVDWARASGFEVVAAGKGTKYLPAYHASTPDTVWGHYGLTPEQAKLGGMKDLVPAGEPSRVRRYSRISGLDQSGSPTSSQKRPANNSCSCAPARTTGSTTRPISMPRP